MKKLQFILAGFLLIAGISSQSQTTIDKFPGFVTFDDQLIKTALDSTLFIIRQDYVLQSTNPENPKEFGKGGNPYFGRIYSVAISAGNRLWADGRLKTPWLYDENYKGYENADSLKPVLTNTYIRRVSEKNFRKASVILDDSLKSDIFYYLLKQDLRGVTYLQGSKDSAGWAVIVYTREDISLNDSCDLYIFSFRPRPQFRNNNVATIKMIQKENILGGGYFTAGISVGSIRFSLAGMLFRKAQAWMVSVLPQDMKSELNEIKRSDSDLKKEKKVKK